MRQGINRGVTGASCAAIVAAALSLSPISAEALKSDDSTLIEGAKLCTRYLPRHERQYGIPEHLLAAIASTESGRFHKALGLNLPWPWTINVEGAGYFFDTKEEAIAAVQSFQARGISSIDVGCMQVNLHHHPTAFASLEQAFDPAYNVAYAAQFLKSNFEQEGSWRKATADYHSRTLFFGEQYAQLVYGAWGRIINKVADARAGRPILNAYAARAGYSYTGSHPHVYQPMHLHDISVAHEHDPEATRERGVLVIRPEHDDMSPAIAQQASLEADRDNFVATGHPPAPITIGSERSAISPDGFTPANLQPLNTSHEPQIVHVNDASSGQFQGAHIVHADNSDSGISSAVPVSAAAVVSGANSASLRDSASSASLRDSGPTTHAGGGDGVPKNPFVFNN